MLTSSKTLPKDYLSVQVVLHNFTCPCKALRERAILRIGAAKPTSATSAHRAFLSGWSGEAGKMRSQFIKGHY